MLEIRWRDVAADFADEDSGSALRELMVPDVGIGAWQRFLDRIRGSGWRTRYGIDGEPAPLPSDVGSIFGAASAASVALRIELGGPDVDVWFFDECVVHCSVAAAAVTSQVELDRLLAFLREVGRACGQPAYLTYEGGADDPRRYAFLCYDPSDDGFCLLTPSPLGPGPVLGDPTRFLLLEDGDVVRLLLWQQAAWADSPAQRDEIANRLRAATTYLQSEQLDWERAESPDLRWRIEIRCVTAPPPSVAATFDRARDSIRAHGGDLVVRPPGANGGWFD